MNASLIILEIAVLVLGLAILLIDLWTPPARKRLLGYGAAAGLTLILIFSFVRFGGGEAQTAFGDMYVLDGLALFFKRFFLVAAIVVTLIAVEFSDRIEAGVSEFYSLITFALSGMMFAASANDFTMLFVSMELITVSFYILTSFQRARLISLEAGIKYLILGALASAFLIYGIALVYGTAGTMKFGVLADKASELARTPLFLLGLLLIVTGLAFKIAAFPLQIWAPDVYQGAPTPTTAFLAVGSKAAGFALLWRVLFFAVPHITAEWTNLLIAIAAISILYGNLCALPQRNLKRLFGYSSIAHAGYLLLGIAAMAANVRNPAPGGGAILYYLSGYLFTVLGAFAVICMVMRHADAEDISALAGLNQRSPLLAAVMTLAMVSLAGIPPLAGFFGKFLLLRAALEHGSANHGFYCLAGVVIVGVVISLYYYFGVVRVIYWSDKPANASRIAIPVIQRVVLYTCVAGMLCLGLFPGAFVSLTLRTATRAPAAVVTHSR